MTREHLDGQIARIDTALTAALNMVEGDGMPPDWDYLRLVRKQLYEFRAEVLSALKTA